MRCRRDQRSRERGGGGERREREKLEVARRQIREEEGGRGSGESRAAVAGGQRAGRAGRQNGHCQGH